MCKTIAFIGAGNMGGAIIRATCRVVDSREVAIYDVLTEKADALAAETGCVAAGSGAEALDGAAYVMLCVKPQYYADTLRGLLPALKKNADAGVKQTLASIVTGAKMQTIAGLLAEGGLDLPIIRIMPNTPASVGKGVMLLARSEAVTEENFAAFQQIISGCGRLVPMSEHMLDIATPVSGCSPAFVYMFIDALADGGVQIGVPREQARILAAQTVLGSAAMVLESGIHPGELKDNVCSPAGSTIAGVEKLEEHAFRYAVAQSIVAAYERNCQLG